MLREKNKSYGTIGLGMNYTLPLKHVKTDRNGDSMRIFQNRIKISQTVDM